MREWVVWQYFRYWRSIISIIFIRICSTKIWIFFLVQQYCPYLLYTSCIALFYHFPALVRIRQTGSLFINRETVTLSSENTETIFPMQVQCASYVRKYVSKAEKVRSGPKKCFCMRLKSREGREGQYWSGEADLCNLIYPVSAPPAYLMNTILYYLIFSRIGKNRSS